MSDVHFDDHNETDNDCPNCGGEGVIHLCVDEIGCECPEEGCDLCERRCDWCQKPMEAV